MPSIVRAQNEDDEDDFISYFGEITRQEADRGGGGWELGAV